MNYATKFEKLQEFGLFQKLDSGQQDFVRSVAFEQRLTFQEFRQVVEIVRDLAMWGEDSLAHWWRSQSEASGLTGRQLKKHLLGKLQEHIGRMRSGPKVYPKIGLPRPKAREKYKVVSEQSDKTIHGMCPVASESTVCCNLRTIDAVENCAFGCSYCTIQTFYNDTFVFDADFAEKLKAIELDPDRFYHFGTGQSSDSLAWGNRNGNLDALCQFAADNPNVLLEFKTKSHKIKYFLQNEVPQNIVCSWSLNTPTIVQNEEHFTASLDQRIAAARTVANQGIKVSFHFHPMVYYQGWQIDYPEIAQRLDGLFDTDEVLFISFGSITMIKPAIKQIRGSGLATKILQMEMVPDPHGKLTYPDDIKTAMFKKMYQAFAPWQNKVFFYLCMEKASIWEETFGFVYPDNDEFERDFLDKCMGKIALPALES